jgi:hypothetical protein
LFGAIRPPPPLENLDERCKQPKSEPEPEEKQKPVQKRRQKAAWELKAFKDLTPSDFSMYDDAVKPFRFACTRFVYRNKAMIKEEKEVKAASADYIKRSRNLSVSKNLNLSSDFAFHSIYYLSLIIIYSGQHSPSMLSPLQI